MTLHPWLFDLSSPTNSSETVRARVRFVGGICERFLALTE